MNLLTLLNFTILAADREYETVEPMEQNVYKGGVLDTLYKGSLLMQNASGYAIVAADGAQASLTFPIGICTKQVSVAGAFAEDVVVENGRMWLQHTSAARTDVGDIFYATDDNDIAESTSGIDPLGLCVGFKTGYLLIDTRIKSVKV